MTTPRPADIDLLPAPPGCVIRRTRRYDYPQIVFGPEGMQTVRHAVAVSYAGYVACRPLSRAELRLLRSAARREITFTGSGGDIGLDGYLIGIDVQTIMQGRPYSEDDFRAELEELAEMVRKMDRRQRWPHGPGEARTMTTPHPASLGARRPTQGHRRMANKKNMLTSAKPTPQPGAKEKSYMSKKPPEWWSAAVRLHQQGETPEAIAKTYDVGSSYVRRLLADAGQVVARKKHANKGRKREPTEDARAIAEQVIGYRDDDGLTFTQIGALLGFSKQRAHNIYKQSKEQA